MKFIFFVAFFAVKASADQCDPSKMSVEYYKDEQCTYLNEELTKINGGSIKPRDYNAFDGRCRPMRDGNFSVNVWCDKNGFHEKIYEGKHCEKEWQINKQQENGQFDFEWNTCENPTNVNWHLVIRTTQTFQDKDE